ncbi:MAG: hypothetical protein PHD97_01350 [Bacteroidales bacterium]|nr:hypothetical protein [Bacteroidales bacterium]
MFKKIFLYFICTFAFIMFFSCNNSTSNDAAKYNDSLVSLQLSIADKIDALDSTFADYKSDKMDKAYSEAMKQVLTSIEKVNKMNAFKDEKEIKEAMLKLFETYKSVLENEYSKIIALNKLAETKFSLSDEKKVDKLSSDIDNKLDSAIVEIEKKQKEFATKYKIKLEEE